MSRYLNNPGEVPPGGYRFYQAETKFTVTAPSWKDLLVAVQKHRHANLIPVGANFDREIEDAVCAQAPPNWCSDNNPNRTAEVPRPEWPLWAKAMALMATDADTGVGDTIARVVGPIGGEAFKGFYEKTFGHSCGCSVRQADYNLQFPYKK